MPEELQEQSTTESGQEAPVDMDTFIGEQFDALESAADETGVADAPVNVKEEITEQEAQEPEKDTEAKASDEVDEAESDEPDESLTVTAPQSMSAKDSEAFYALPPESQKWLSDRMKEQESTFTKKTMELAEQRKSFDALEKVIGPRREQLALDGMDAGTAVGQLFALSDFANRDPLGFTRYLLNQRGIPVSALTEPGDGINATPDPQLQAVMSEINGLKNSITQQQAQAQDVAAKSISTTIDEFAKDKAFPFYSELEGDMVPLVASFRQSQPGLSNKEYLSKAYAAALAGNAEISARVAADNKAKTEAARIAKAKKDAARAKKAAGTNVKGGGALPAAAAKAKSVDEFIGALVDERMTA